MKQAFSYHQLSVFLCIALIAYLTLYPFKFQFTLEQFLHGLQRAESVPFLNNKFHSALGPDFLANILLYLPFGFLLFGFCRQRQLPSPLRTALLIAAAVSASTELMQLFVPNRFCSSNDLMNNVAGAALGYLLSRQFHRGAEKTRLRIRRFLSKRPVFVLWLALLALQAALALFPFMITAYPRHIQSNMRHWLYSWSELSWTGTEMIIALQTMFFAMILVFVLVAALPSDLKKSKAIHSAASMVLLSVYPVIGALQLIIRSKKPTAAFVLSGLIGVGIALQFFYSTALLRQSGKTAFELKRNDLKRLCYFLYALIFLLHFFGMPFETDSSILHFLPTDISVVFVLYEFQTVCLAIPVGYSYCKKFAGTFSTASLRYLLIILLGIALFITLVQRWLFGSAIDVLGVAGFVVGGLFGVLIFSFYNHLKSMQVGAPRTDEPHASLAGFKRSR